MTVAGTDHYLLLDLAPDAGADQIERAIREQRRTWSRRAGLADPALRAEAEQRIARLAEAERTLLDAEARASFDAQRTAAPRRPAPRPGLSTRRDHQLISAARAALRTGDAVTAHQLASEATALANGNAEAWSVRARVSAALGHVQDATREAAEAARLAPADPEVRFAHAEVLCSAGQYPAALGELQVALAANPTEPRYRTALAKVWLATGDYERALQTMEAVVRDSGEDDHERNRYLAVALHRVARAELSRDEDGARVITSAAQIESLRTLSTRALELPFDDDRLRIRLREDLDAADEAEAPAWAWQGWGWWVAAFVLALALVFVTPWTLLVAVLIVVGFVLIHRRPAWRHNARHVPIPQKGV